MRLFADAKMSEDIIKYSVRVEGTTDDFGEMGETLPQVLRDEVTGEVHLEAILHAMDGVESAGEGFVMTEIGDNDIVL